MLRKVVRIDEDACTGCGLCVNACHEGAIEMRGGKAHLVSDVYCDGLGDCLPACPAGAIHVEEREASPYAHANPAKTGASGRPSAAARPVPFANGTGAHHAHQCPGSRARVLNAPAVDAAAGREAAADASAARAQAPSQLRNWPVQMKLAPVQAPYFDGASLLVAADCAAYAFAGFHERFIEGNTVLIGCPKLDQEDYSEKLGAIIASNDVRGVRVVRMVVPCCSALDRMASAALAKSGKDLPLRVTVLSMDGAVSYEQDLAPEQA